MPSLSSALNASFILRIILLFAQPGAPSINILSPANAVSNPNFTAVSFSYKPEPKTSKSFSILSCLFVAITFYLRYSIYLFT